MPTLPPGVTVRLVLVRHGEPDEQIRGRCYGRLDVGLSDRGRQQVINAGDFLCPLGISAIYSSPRRRALESAQVLAEARCPVNVDDRLGEIDFGDFEGMSYDDIARRFPDLYDEWMARPTVVKFPGGESFADMQVRVSEALGDLRRAHENSTVAVVSHGGVNRIALAAALGLAPGHMFRIDQAYACVNVIDYLPQDPVVRVVNACGTFPC